MSPTLSKVPDHATEKGFAILIKLWKITLGEWEAIALFGMKGDRSLLYLIISRLLSDQFLYEL